MKRSSELAVTCSQIGKQHINSMEGGTVPEFKVSSSVLVVCCFPITETSQVFCFYSNDVHRFAIVLRHLLGKSFCLQQTVRWQLGLEISVKLDSVRTHSNICDIASGNCLGADACSMSKSVSRAPYHVRLG